MAGAPLALVSDAGDRLDVERAAAFLSRCRSVDGVRDVRDKARAIAVYQRTRGAAYEAQADAAEIALRAERRLGELCAELPKKQGDRDSNRVLESKSLADLGISHVQSSRWQAISRVPEPDFEAYVTETRVRQERLTVAALINKIRRDERVDVEPEPFHSIVAAGRFKDAIRARALALIAEWPAGARSMVSMLLHDLADELSDMEVADDV